MVEDAQQPDIGESSTSRSPEEAAADWNLRAAIHEEEMSKLHDERVQALATPEQQHHIEQAELRRRNAEHFRNKASEAEDTDVADWHRRAAEQEEEMAGLHDERVQALITPEQQHHTEQAQLRRRNAEHFRNQAGVSSESE